jgi:cation diffusion facilitator family transporter
MIQDNRAVIKRVLLITLILNITVMAIKITIGLASNSLSLIADALHSLTDSANNVLGLVASRYSSPIPDREHPYGHQKYEAIGALGITAFLGIACFEILQGAIDRLLNAGKGIALSTQEFWLLLLVLGINIFVAFYERKEGNRVKSPLLIADAYHTMSDIWVTIAVLVGLLGIKTLGWQWLDIALAFPVAVMVFWSGWTVLKQNLPWLVDEIAIAPEAIQSIVLTVPGVVNVHSIASRGLVGRQTFIEMHLIVSAQDVETAHQITEMIEEKLEANFNPVRIMIHVEPLSYMSDQLTYEEH